MIANLTCKKCGHTFNTDVYKTVERVDFPRHMIYGGVFAECENCKHEELSLEYPKVDVPNSKGANFMRVQSMNEQQKKEYFKKRAKNFENQPKQKEEHEFTKNRIISGRGTIS